MKEMCYKLHTNGQAMDSVETVSMQSVLTDVQGEKEQNKARGVPQIWKTFGMEA